MAEPTDIAEELDADGPRPLARITVVLAVAAAVRAATAVGGW